MTPAQMDALIDQHFRFEASDDVEGVVATLAQDVEHEIIPSPAGLLRDREAIRRLYQRLFSDLRGEGVTPLRRLYGPDFVLDESLWEGQITDGGLFLCPGRSGRVQFRLLHVFELRDGKIARETVWCDLAAIQRQLGALPEAAPTGGRRG